MQSICDVEVHTGTNLSYTKHIHDAINKAKRNLGLIKRHSAHFNNTRTISILYCALVRSHLEFEDVVWESVTKSEEKAIEKIQKQFLRYLDYREFRYYDPLLSYRELTIGFQQASIFSSPKGHSSHSSLLIEDALVFKLNSTICKSLRPRITNKLRLLRKAHDETAEYFLKTAKYVHSIEAVSEHIWRVASIPLSKKTRKPINDSSSSEENTDSEDLVERNASPKMYKVERIREACGTGKTDKCNLKCTECNTCFHSYRCSMFMPGK